MQSRLNWITDCGSLRGERSSHADNQGTSFMRGRISRRQFFAGVGTVAAAPRSVVGQARRTRLVLLGTGGGAATPNDQFRCCAGDRQ